MENEKVLDILRECGSLLEGHFLLTSGNHSNRYCQCAQLLQYPDKAKLVVEEIVKNLGEITCDVVVGPAMGGIVIGYEVARQLGARSIFTEREEGEMTFRRGFSINPGEKVMIAEDVITTGLSTLETAKAIEAMGGTVVALACLVDRRGGKHEMPFPVISATTLQVDNFPKEDCTLCKEGVPVVKPGSRKI